MSYSTDSEKYLNYGTRRYEYAWEEMVNKTFGSDDVDIKDYFPEAYWTVFKAERKRHNFKT